MLYGCVEDCKSYKLQESDKTTSVHCLQIDQQLKTQWAVKISRKFVRQQLTLGSIHFLADITV